MLSAAADAGRGIVYGAVGPELRFGAAELGRRRISRPPDASVPWGGGVWGRLRCGCRWHRECCGWCAAMRAAAWLRARGRFGAGRRHRGCGRSGASSTPDGKIRAPCVIRGVRAAKSAPSWQDIHVVYPPTAICRAFRIHGTHILPKPAHFGCMACESCQEGAILPSEAPFGIHGVKKLPRIAARERIRAQSCHRQAPAHFTGILPSVSARNATAPCASTSCVAAPSMLAPNAPPMPYVPVAHAPAPPATAPRCHAPYAALLSPLKK